MDRRTLALLAVFIVQILYGLNFTFAKAVINEGYIQPFALVLLRVSGAALLFWLLSLVLPREKIDKKDFLLFFVAAIFGIATNMLLFLKGLELTTPIHAAVIMTITPITILVLSAAILKERVTKLKILGVFLGFCGGVLLTALGTSERIGDNVVLGNTFVFINAVSYSIYIIIIKKLTQKYHPFTFIKWLFLFGFFLVLPFGYHELTEVKWHTFTPSAVFSVGFVVVGATFLTYFLNPLALRKLKASTIGIFIYLQPVVAGIFAILMGSDSISFIKILAMLLIFFGVYLVTKSTKNLA